MIGFTYFSASNPVHRTIEVSHPSMLPDVDAEGDQWLETPSLPAAHWATTLGPNGPEAVPFERPAGLAFVLAAAAKRAEVNALRLRHETGGCATPLGRMDTDADSQRKVNGSVTMALIAQAAGRPFSIDWTMADNTTLAHDGPAMIAAGVAVGQHVSACHERALELKAAIETAADMAALAAIDIEQGWP